MVEKSVNSDHLFKNLMKYLFMPENTSVAWKVIENNPKTTGHIAYYYSDSKADLPVRGIRKKWDSKADPNIETKTYGLFSTCMPPARKNMVTNRDSYIFFFTKWRGQRMFTGYYELGYFVDTGIIPTANGKARKFPDYALLAKRTHFVRNGIPLTGDRWSIITEDSFNDGVIDGYGPRDFKQIDSKLTNLLKSKLDEQKDITGEYVKEIYRLENENLQKYGYKYPSWKRREGFTKDDFKEFIK
jgi:hypothetical protein